MKRTDFIRYLLKCGCVLAREGAKHSVYLNPIAKRVSTVPRHREVNDFLAKKICADLGILFPGKDVF
jgi:predicted RNA binding protein YcfA (HicA-like mRNA interferase family)